jgi:arylsulfatase A-like enzyme/tetratricopeptide (TPR) repeat protein
VRPGKAARARAALPAASGALLLALGGCAPGSAPPAQPKARHLVLVTIDTLRADRVGCYGSDVATPHLDAIAREGAMAPQAMAHVSLTRPSHTSLFTGLLPSQHGIRDNVSPSLPPQVPTLAPMLKAAGFRTAGFVSSIVLSRQSGLDRGFDVYSDRFQADADDARFLNSLQKRGDVTLAEALEWLEKAPKAERLFLWLHLYDPHDPYEPPEPYASRYPGRPYEGEIAWSDELVGRLDAALLRLGLKPDTLLVVTSDHGEGLGEHGENAHGFFVYQSTLRVPLLLRGPGIPPGTRLTVTARTTDLLPTALDLLGVRTPAGTKLEGRSLAAPLRGGGALPEAPAYAESLLPLLHFGWSDLRCLREGRFKYIEAPRPELYDLQQDPGETRDLARAEPSRAEAMRAALAAYVEAERSAVKSTAGAGTVPPDLLEKLGALGYLGAGAPGQGATPGADPKDKIEEFKVVNRLIREGLIKQRAKDFAGSAASFRELLRRRIESFEVHYYLGKALLGLKRYGEAAPHFEGAIRFQPAYAMAHESLAECRAAQGDLKGAIAALRKGREAAPTDPSLPRTEGGYWERLGNRGEAIRAYEAALPLAPKNAWLRIRLGELLRDAGDLERAAALMREAVALDPSTASYWNALGMVLGARGQLEEAEKAFREATSRDGGDAKYAYNLGLALLRQGKGADAAPHFRKALELDPRFAEARTRLRELEARR